MMDRPRLFRFLHAADLHLDSPLRGLARRGEVGNLFVDASRRALEGLVATAINEKVAFVVIAGDIFDGDWRDYATGQFFVRQMGRLAREGIRVFAVRGNHDAESVITRTLPVTAGYHVFGARSVETVRIEEFGVALHGRSFANRHVQENVALTYPPAVPGWFNIGVLHTSLDGREGHGDYAPCSVDDLRQLGYDYWALGHVHERELVADDPPILFPGNLQGRHAREAGPKGATLITVQQGRVVEMRPLTLDAARFDHVRLDVTGISDRGALLEQLRRAFADAYDRAENRPLALRVTLFGESALHDTLVRTVEQTHEDLQALAWESGDDLLIEKLVNLTVPLSDMDQPIVVPGLDSILAEAAADPILRGAISDALAELRRRAPVEALESAGLADGSDTIERALGTASALIRAELSNDKASAENKP